MLVLIFARSVPCLCGNKSRNHWCARAGHEPLRCLGSRGSSGGCSASSPAPAKMLVHPGRSSATTTRPQVQPDGSLRVTP
jgi:hypothetical protein